MKKWTREELEAIREQATRDLQRIRAHAIRMDREISVTVDLSAAPEVLLEQMQRAHARLKEQNPPYRLLGRTLPLRPVGEGLD